MVKQQLVAIQMVFYRNYLLEVLDEIGAGWRVVLHPPADCSAAREVLRTARADGLKLLLAGARDRVEQLLAPGMQELIGLSAQPAASRVP